MTTLLAIHFCITVVIKYGIELETPVAILSAWNDIVSPAGINQADYETEDEERY